MAPQRQAGLLSVSVALLSGVRAYPLEGTLRPPYEIVLTGSCDAKRELDGLLFRKEGDTLSGAPWYKAVDKEQYIYYDPDCAGSTDGTPRWIIDSDRPNVNAAGDLDGDGVCMYHARVNSRDPSHPPFFVEWIMECSDGWRTQNLALVQISSTTSTETTTTSTSNTKTSSTRTTTKVGISGANTTNNWTGTGPAPWEEEEIIATEELTVTAQGRFMLLLDCPCEFKSYLNGLVFGLEGYTADSAPYYKADSLEAYIYHDVDCDGPAPKNISSTTNETMPSRSVARWVLDMDRPLIDRPEGDLDADSRCDYHARLDSVEGERVRPPSMATWRMNCGANFSWQDVNVTLREIDDGELAVAARSTTRPATEVQTIFVSGAPGHGGLPPLLLLALLGRMLAK